MTKTEMLYQAAYDSGITICEFDLPQTKSLAYQSPAGNGYIAVDPAAEYSIYEKNECLAHEMGHLLTGSLYNASCPIYTRGKCERRADIWAIKKLVPKHKLEKAVKNGYTELWELAELFQVTEKLMWKAILYWKENNC